jgi:polysaccharide chain length determinant protein (PEP-CTERM system associated)
MYEFIGDLLNHLRALWRWRWLGAAVAWSVCVATWLVVMFLPNVFQSTARVYVDTRTALQPVLKGIAVEQDVDSKLNLVRQALLSRPQLEKVARKTDLDVKVADAADMDVLIRELRDDITIDLQQKDQNQTASVTDSLYTISYRHADREKSLAVVRNLVDSFVGDTLGANSADSDTAQRFLRDQIQEYEARLSESEARLADFKKRNMGLLPGGEKGDYFSRLNAELEAQQRAETELTLAVNRRAELQRQLGAARPYIPGTSNAGGSGSGLGPSDLSVRVQESEAKLDELLLRYTDKHPEVIALRDTIRELKEREAKELTDIKAGGAGTGAIRSLSANPVFQSIQLQLNQADVDIASLRGAVAQHRTEVANLRKFVDTAPEVEQELARLNRDYDVTKAQYQALVERLEKARVSEDADQTGIVRFEVIDPPSADANPVAPNRPLLTIGGLLLGLLAALATAFVAGQMAPTFANARTLENATGLPVIGSVGSYSPDGSLQADLRDRKRLTVVFGALCAVCLVVIVIGGSGASLVQRLVG